MSRLQQKSVFIKTALDETMFDGKGICPVSYTQLFQDFGEAVKFQIQLIIDEKYPEDNIDELLDLVLYKFADSPYGSHSLQNYCSTICAILDEYYRRGKTYFF